MVKFYHLRWSSHLFSYLSQRSALIFISSHVSRSQGLRSIIDAPPCPQAACLPPCVRSRKQDFTEAGYGKAMRSAVGSGKPLPQAHRGGLLTYGAGQIPGELSRGSWRVGVGTQLGGLVTPLRYTVPERKGKPVDDVSHP